MKIPVIGKYEVELEAADIAHVIRKSYSVHREAQAQKRTYFQFIGQTMGIMDVLNEIHALDRNAADIGRVASVTEFFGGMGLSATVLEARCNPRFHQVIDISRDCCASLRSHHPELIVHQDDSLL